MRNKDAQYKKKQEKHFYGNLQFIAKMYVMETNLTNNVNCLGIFIVET